MTREIVAKPVVALTLVLLGAGPTGTQSRDSQKPTFEVASVKRAESTNPWAGAIPHVLPGGRFYAGLATVEDLLWFAYGLRPHQIVGGPDWVRRNRFEISARAATELPPDQIKRMVGSLLEDRFKLVTHVEQREMQFLALVRARPDGPLGPALIRIDECNPATIRELRQKFPEKYPTPIGNGMISGCSSRGLDDLATLLSIVGMPVIDATSLKDSFYFTIRSQFSPTVALFGATNSNPNLPALSTALDEQLGLKLEGGRGSVEVLVIDRVLMPTEN